MNLIILTLVLALIWASVTGIFTLVNLLFGAAIGVVALVLLRDQMVRPRALVQFRRGFVLFVVFLRELVLSAVRVAATVLDPAMHSRLRPAFVAVPIDLETDGEITLLANLITLTPGTLTIDVSEDRKTLYVHVLTLSDRDALVAEIKSGFEQHVREVFEIERR